MLIPSASLLADQEAFAPSPDPNHPQRGEARANSWDMPITKAGSERDTRRALRHSPTGRRMARVADDATKTTRPSVRAKERGDARPPGRDVARFRRSCKAGAACRGCHFSQQKCSEAGQATMRPTDPLAVNVNCVCRNGVPADAGELWPRPRTMEKGRARRTRLHHERISVVPLVDAMPDRPRRGLRLPGCRRPCISSTPAPDGCRKRPVRRSRDRILREAARVDPTRGALASNGAVPARDDRSARRRRDGCRHRPHRGEAPVMATFPVGLALSGQPACGAGASIPPLTWWHWPRSKLTVTLAASPYHVPVYIALGMSRACSRW